MLHACGLSKCFPLGTCEYCTTPTYWQGPTPPFVHFPLRKWPQARGTKGLYISEWGGRRLLHLVLSWISFVHISYFGKATLQHMRTSPRDGRYSQTDLSNGIRSTNFQIHVRLRRAPKKDFGRLSCGFPSCASTITMILHQAHIS